MQSTECDRPEPSDPPLVAEVMFWLADKLEEQSLKTEKRTFTEEDRRRASEADGGRTQGPESPGSCR